MSTGTGGNDETRYRKIHPIYQAIDVQNYKGAIKLCQRKEIMKWDIAKALMAYCLVMCNKVEEGLAVAREVKDNHPTDDSVLSALALTFRHGKAEAECCECYENAYAAMPSNLGLANDLFASYVKCGEFKKMQQLSQKLYKSTGDSKFIFWTVSSMLHQLDSLPVAMLDLAEKMIMKIVGDPSTTKGAETPGAEELKLLVEILRKRASHPSSPVALKCELLERALSQIRELSTRPAPAPIHDNTVFTQDPSIVKSHPTHLKLLSIDILKDLHTYRTTNTDQDPDVTDRILEANERVIQILREVLEELPDQWDALEALVTVHHDSYCRDRALGDSRLGSLRKDLLQMQSLHPDNRGPYLAEMLLLRLWTEERFSESSSHSSTIPESWKVAEDEAAALTADFALLDLNGGVRTLTQQMVLLIAQYVSRFENKQCCFTDIKPYLASLDLKENRQFLDWIRDRAEALRSSLSANVENFNRAVSEQKTDGKEVPEQICRLSKLLQMDYFLKVAESPSTTEQGEEAWPFIRSLVNLYCVTHEVAGGRGVGGLREVQPGDELLMLASTAMKRQLLASRNGNVQEDESLRLSTKWAVLLGIGREKSPHSYCFTVELLEPLRYLCCSRYALDLFNTLGVRYIQLDSMPYLILTLLSEGGLFTEHYQLSRNIVSFHESARRDTLTSIAKSFTYCNYAKGLELGEFSQRCQRSTQLALSRAEVPIFEVVDKLPSTLPAISAYLQGYVAHMHPESQSELTEANLSGLMDNMDYDLLTRVDEDPFARGEMGKKIRRGQYEARIRAAQSLLRVIFSTLQDDFQSATMRISTAHSQLWERAAPSPAVDPFGAPFEISPLPAPLEEPVLWSQLVCSGEMDEVNLERKSTEAILRICALSITAIQLDRLGKAAPSEQGGEGASEQATLPLRESLRAICGAIHSVLAEIRTGLGAFEGEWKYLEGSGRTLLRPSWLRKVSCLSRGLGTWGAVVLSHLEASVLKEASTNKKKKAAKKAVKAATDSEERILVIGVIQEVKKLLGSLESDLDHSPTGAAALSQAAEYLRACCVELAQSPEMADLTAAAVERSIQTLAKQLLSSQELSCVRMRETLRGKRGMLETAA